MSYERFWREVTRDGKEPCALEDGTCDGPLDAHHYVPKRRLRTPEAKTDSRNGVPLCRRHHELVERAMARSPKPRFLSFFLAEHNVPSRDVPYRTKD